jgi:hypothetical protein
MILQRRMPKKIHDQAISCQLEFFLGRRCITGAVVPRSLSLASLRFNPIAPHPTCTRAPRRKPTRCSRRSDSLWAPRCSAARRKFPKTHTSHNPQNQTATPLAGPLPLHSAIHTLPPFWGPGCINTSTEPFPSLFLPLLPPPPPFIVPLHCTAPCSISFVL